MLALRSPLKIALLGAFWTVFLLGFFLHAPIIGFAHIVGLCVIAGLSVLAAYGFGAWPLERLAVHVTSWERALFSIGLGWGVISFLMVLLGIIHGWIPVSAYGLLVIGIGLAWAHRRYVTKRGSIDREKLPNNNWKAYAWLLIPAFATGTLIALAPITYYDSLVYHLALPAAYVRAGHWIGWPDLIYSGFPQNLEMLWTFGLLTGVTGLPSLISWTLAILLLVVIETWCRRYLDARTGAIAVAFLLWMPAFQFLSSGGYVDIGLALYFFLSLHALGFCLRDRSMGAAALAGLFAGLAAGIKYTGILSIGLGLIGLFSMKARPRAIGAYCAASVLAFAPWLIKNFHYVGNPVFPFFYNWGNPALNPWAHGAAGYFRALVEYQPHSLAGLPALLWKLAVNGFQFGKGADVLGDYGWTLFIACLPLLAWAKKELTPVRFASGYALVFFIAWGMTRPVLRFLLPMAPVLAILGAYGWTQSQQHGKRVVRIAARVIVGLLLISNTVIFFQMADVFEPFRVPLGLQSREDYLQHKLTYYGAASFINKFSPADVKVIVAGDQRTYYYQRNVLAWTVFNENPLVGWADHAASPAALHEQMTHYGSVLVVNRAEMQRLAPYHAWDFSSVGEKNWEGLLNSMPPVYHDAWCDVYQL